MSTTLKHSIKINGSPEQVFQALTEIDQMAAWHQGSVTGKIAVGSVMNLNPKSGLKFAWETEEIVKNTRIVQKCVEGPGNSAGKTLVFDLSDADAGMTLVKLSDGEWSEDDPHLPFCNTHWGGVLHNLKKYVEKT